ncbi:MAG: ABC transporter substrate-binding protein [Janthinobacterium lividum]
MQRPGCQIPGVDDPAALPQRLDGTQPRDHAMPPILARRRTVLGMASALAAGGVVPAGRAADAAPEQAAIELAAVRDTQLGAQVAVADALSLFKPQGLEVTVHWTQSGADIITFMAGRAQYLCAGGSFSGIVLASQGLPVRIIAALADMAGTQGLALAPGVTLASPADLMGKKLAYTQGTPNTLILAKLAQTYGFDASKVSLISMEPTEGVTAALRGDVQGILGFEPFLYRLVHMGGTLYVTGTELDVTGTPRRLAMEDRLIYVHSCLLAAQDWIATKPNTLQAVLRGLQAATDVINHDRPRAVAVMQKLLHLEEDAVTRIMSENSYSLAIDDALARSIRFQSDWAVGIKRIPMPVSPQQLIDPTLLRAVDPALVTWSGKA